MIVEWRIYYDDDTTYDNLQGSWEDAPRDGVIVVVVRSTDGVWGRYCFSGFSPWQREANPHEFCQAAHKQGTNEFYVKFPDTQPFACWDLRPTLRKLGLIGEYDAYDMEQQYALAAKIPQVKFGRYVSQDKWQELVRRASTDKDFPVGTPRRRASDIKP